MIAIIDYGVGNLFSLTASLKQLGIESCVTADPAMLEKTDGLILPGVGAFGDAAQKLRSCGLPAVLTKLVQAGKPLLGICLGMQLLFEKGYEYGCHEGLGLLPGEVHSLREDIKNAEALVPHMGWNQLRFVKKDPLLQTIPTQRYMYFVHSYYAKNCEAVLLADALYEGVAIPAIVGKGKVYGMQFHPEKSGVDGLQLLQAFANLCRR